VQSSPGSTITSLKPLSAADAIGVGEGLRGFRSDSPASQPASEAEKKSEKKHEKQSSILQRHAKPSRAVINQQHHANKSYSHPCMRALPESE
jgi:hypothetical protein